MVCAAVDEYFYLQNGTHLPRCNCTDIDTQEKLFFEPLSKFPIQDIDASTKKKFTKGVYIL